MKNNLQNQNYEYVKIFRKEIDKVNSIHSSKDLNLLNAFITLRSYAVGNVDTEKLLSNLKIADCYFTVSKLKKILKTRNYNYALLVLQNLSDMGVLKYEILNPRSEGNTKIYIYFNICRENIEYNEYDKNNFSSSSYYTCHAAFSKKRYGFILLKKKVIIKYFFNKNNTIEHGNKDLYWLLKLNGSYNDNQLTNNLNNENLQIPFVNWGLVKDNEYNAFKFYITYNELAIILNTTIRKVYLAMKSLSNNGLISKRYLRTRGTIIILSYYYKLVSKNKNKNKTIKNKISEFFNIICNYIIKNWEYTKKSFYLNFGIVKFSLKSKPKCNRVYRKKYTSKSASASNIMLFEDEDETEDEYSYGYESCTIPYYI